MNTKEEKIRGEVIQEARKLFQRFGLFKTTMEDIAKALNKGKSTLYYYYKSKEDIFEDVVTNEINGVFSEMRTAVEKCSTAEEKLHTYFYTAVHTIKERILLYKMMKGEIGENLKTIVGLKYRMDNREVHFIKDILLYGIEKDEFIASIDKDVDLMAYSIVSALRGITLDLVVEEKFPNWDERIGVLSEVFIRGLKK